MPNILVVNCGSSSIKFSVVDPQNEIHILSGLAERLGASGSTLAWKGQQSGTQELGTAHHADALKALVKLLHEIGIEVAATGHRMVHGAERFSASCLVSPDVLEHLEAVSHLAPLHNPVNLLGVRAAVAAFPNLDHVLVFDTAFHQTMPKHVYLYPIPYPLYSEHGIRRYGFHGTSHRYVTAKAAEMLDRPLGELALLSAHLGNGCSATAVLNGKSVDTTMGLTPLEGLVMGTRSGDVDPSLHAHLCDQLGLNLTEVMNILNRQSGLLGISGESNDMRTLLELEASGDERAGLAVQIFCYRLARQLAGLTVALGRLDALIFTGGIGEHAAAVRQRVIGLLPFLGLEPDADANAVHGAATAGRITGSTAPCALVVKTDEELMIAKDTFFILSQT